MSQNKVVEFLPWVHDINYQAHYNVIDHLHTLKKGSFVGLEINTFFLKKANHFLDLKKNGDYAELLKDKLYVNLNKDSLNAVLQVVQTCNHRGLKIIPLLRDQLMSKLVSTHLDNKNYITKTFSKWRVEKTDSDLAESICEFLRTKDNLSVIMGLAHIRGVELNLDNKFNHMFPKYKLNKGINFNNLSEKEKKNIITQMDYCFATDYHNAPRSLDMPDFAKEFEGYKKEKINECDAQIAYTNKKVEARMQKKLHENIIKNAPSALLTKKQKLIFLRSLRPKLK